MANPLTEPLVVRPITPFEPQKQASRSAVNWRAAIQREVREEQSRASAPPKASFGFPQMPATRAASPAFGWDDVHLDRVQRLVHGVIDLGERCVIKLTLPIPICHFGKISANGDLFEHMHDPRADGPDSLP